MGHRFLTSHLKTCVVTQILFLLLPIVAAADTPLLVASQAIDEEVHVWGESIEAEDAGYTSPTSVLLPQDMASINAATTEDLIKFEPSLVIRRRFIGDANGTLGIRGSNMFQTSRSMVFADGVPLHYFLQSRWSGAPRWTMVSASEIAKVEVIYGPFSAEYSGNAMGGVVLIETAIPQKREFHADVSVFNQQFAAYEFDDTVSGNKTFLSYGDKLGDVSLYLSFNRLDNEGHPQIFRGSTPSSSNASDTAMGGNFGEDALGRQQVWYGDSGIEFTETNNYKMKLGYDFGRWQSLFNIALEDRESDREGSTYIQNLDGTPMWGGTDVVINNQAFSFNSVRINGNKLDRRSISLGLRVKGQLSDTIKIESNINQFDIRKDTNTSSFLHPDDPAFTGSGQISDFTNSGWQTAEVKLVVQDFMKPGVEWINGFRHENYELNLDVYDSPNYYTEEKGEYESRFGGKTQLNAFFSQLNWDISEKFDLAIGLRFEKHSSSDGYFSNDDPTTTGLDLVYAPSVESDKTSPKFSFGFKPNNDWLIRYSFAKAYRFPIVEELFRQYEAYNNINEANPELTPEDGTHHNLMFNRSFENGYARVNVFQDNVSDAIESQTDTLPSGAVVSTFVPLDKTRAQGVEFIYNQYDALIDNLDVRFNLTYTDAKILENRRDTDWEGNIYPRMPKWRSNLLATYHISEKWQAGINTQFASDSFARVDNTDTVDEVYGAQDAYLHFGIKTNYQINERFSASFGIDNITNDITYVAHPWPGRTFYLSTSYDM